MNGESFGLLRAKTVALYNAVVKLKVFIVGEIVFLQSRQI